MPQAARKAHRPDPAARLQRDGHPQETPPQGTQLHRFTSTEVQILTPSRNTTARARPRPPCRHRRNTGLRVLRDVDLRVLWRPCRQVSRELSRRCRYSVYLLYCYQSTNTDTCGAATSVLSRAWTSEPWNSEVRADALAWYTNICIYISIPLYSVCSILMYHYIVVY